MISLETVKMHLANVIGAKGCTQLVLKAIAYGLVGLHGLLLSNSGYALHASDCQKFHLG
ncbi:hypothetical protein Syn8016DRAFT_0602 [Synechococcus sp. WH 8016]|nr:hypothetical protein Syn8016DRAFT_0602 [Synechococcus sp. WH 8016]